MIHLRVTLRLQATKLPRFVRNDITHKAQGKILRDKGG